MSDRRLMLEGMKRIDTKLHAAWQVVGVCGPVYQAVDSHLTVSICCNLQGAVSNETMAILPAAQTRLLPALVKDRVWLGRDKVEI